MQGIRAWLLRLAGLFDKQRRDRALADELESHLQFHIDDNLRAGMPAEEARRQALIKLGGIEQTKEAIRSQRGVPWIDPLLQDIRFAFRMLRKNLGFTVVAVLTLALGIGANTAIFSAVNGIVLKQLPYADASQLVSVEGVRRFPGQNIEATVLFSPSIWKQVRQQTPAIAQMALYDNQRGATLTGGAVPEIVPTVHVSSDFFSVLGAKPLLGRPILPADAQPGSKPVAVVSYELWRATWSAEPSLIGHTITLDDEPYEVVGVMPPDCTFPLYGGAKGVWLPLIVPPGEAGDKSVDGMVVARLKNGVSIDAANAQLKTVSSRLTRYFTRFFTGGRFEATGLKRRLGDLDDEMLVLMGAVGFVLLIACVNVSGLLLARGWARQREVAIREALGASRVRIIGQFLTESVLLAFAGGAIGLLLSIWGVHVLRTITPKGMQESGHFDLDAHVLWFTAAVSLLTGILFGLAPAIQASARSIGNTLKENMGGSPGGYSARWTRRVRSALAVFEIAMAVVLVIGATLAARSLERLMAVRLGFHTDHIVTMRANFSKNTCGSAKGNGGASCWLDVGGALANMRGVGGVQSAAAASTLPISTWAVAPNMQIEGQTKELSLNNGDVIADRIVSPDYFRTLGIRLLSGREFLASDSADSGRVTVVDDTFARKYLSNDALGQRISYIKDKSGKPEWMEIVGVIGAVHDLQARQPTRPEIYIPFAQADAFQGANFIVRTTENPTAMTSALKNAIWAVDKNTPITAVATMDQIVAESVAEPRYQTMLLAAFGALGLLLAMVGIYGVISYGVSQRTHEIGVRMALGAHRGNILGMVIWEGMLIAFMGIAAGVLGAIALGRFLQSLLFEVKPTDPATFIGVAVALMLVTMAACYVPARRAMRVDPMVALRHE
jgi:predicted permease